MLKVPFHSLWLPALVLTAVPGSAIWAQTPADRPLPHRVFATSRFSIDRILARPYDSDVPFGASGDRVWATSPQGWAFHDSVQLIYTTNLNAFDLVIQGAGQNYLVARADYNPSHVHMIGAPGVGSALWKASASFTYTTDKVENPLSRPFRPEKRWTCWSSGRREDTFTVDFGKPRLLNGLDLYFFSDVDQRGGCAPPESVRIELFRDGGWHALPPVNIEAQREGRNSFPFDNVQRASQVRVTFRNRGANLYTGLYGFDPHFVGTQRDPQISQISQIKNANGQSGGKGEGQNLRIEGDKWITQDDVLVTRLTVTNPGKTPRPLFVRMDSELSGTEHGFADQRNIEGFPLYLVGGGTDGSVRDRSFLLTLHGGETRTFTFACAVASDRALAAERLKRVLASPDPLAEQVAAYQGWFDNNIACFTCSDPDVAKMYYHRWYNVKKNSMDPKLGRLRHRTFAEGRWTSDWYANVISYGAGHQVDEARWLRDPSYAWGHLQTWTDNPRPDGIYPSHITPKGQQGGQYTDWITSTAWDAYLVHPDKAILAGVADTLARNAEGWRKVYGWNNSPLLVVDSHWWTGMEWQPSFFSFADYHTGGGDGTNKADMTPLRRVDLTAYNYANAQAVANIYRELGRTGDAARLQALADATRDALATKMWNPDTHWFHSLRASDDAVAPAKEIIGLYPFSFDMPPSGKGYEAAWNVALDPNEFWTAWPLASAAKDCPAYAQNGWPVGPGGSGCMWNGPTWPHANSLVFNAMANTLRHYAPCALTRRKLLEMFVSFTRTQYKNQDRAYPWTGEYYNGDTGVWKTTQRDYNHSTWVDPLIRHLLGLVPRADNILEIDPLLPPDAWSYWRLDGQAYRGHDVTLAYDAQGGHIAPGFKGFAVYLDGKQIYHGDRPKHLLYDMAAHGSQRGKSAP
jgi:hypothetical protein